MMMIVFGCRLKNGGGKTMFSRNPNETLAQTGDNRRVSIAGMAAVHGSRLRLYAGISEDRIMMFTLRFGLTWTGRLLIGCMNGLVNICSRLSAAVLLIAGIPVMGVLFLLHLATNRDGGPFLYKGLRLGKDKRIVDKDLVAFWGYDRV